MSLSDQQFLQQFEQQILPASEFNHRGHLRLAWLYLNQYPLAEAIDKTAQGIKAYAESLEAYDKFHHTMTEAILTIMHRRLQQRQFVSLEEFLGGNPDLVENVISVVHRYYSQERLASPVAKCRFVEPDLQPL